MSSSSERRIPCLRPTHWTRSASQPARSRTAEAARSNSPARDSTAAIPARVSPALSSSLRGSRARGGALGLDRRLRQLRQAGEPRGVGDGHVGQHLAVEQRAGGVEAGDQAAVVEPVETGGGVDADDPQAAQLPLLLPPVAVGVDARLVHGLLGDAVGVRLGSPEAAGELEDLLAFLQALVAALDTSHLSNLVSAPRP